MMGSRSSQSAGADALTGMLALVNDPKKVAKRLEEMQAEMAKVEQARADLHRDQAAHQEILNETKAMQRDLSRRETQLATDHAALLDQKADHEKAVAAFEKRAAEFEERDRVRDNAVRAERRAIAKEREEVDAKIAENKATEKHIDERLMSLGAERDELERERDKKDALQAQLSAKLAALSAIVNGDDA